MVTNFYYKDMPTEVIYHDKQVDDSWKIYTNNWLSYPIFRIDKATRPYSKETNIKVFTQHPQNHFLNWSSSNANFAHKVDLSGFEICGEMAFNSGITPKFNGGIVLPKNYEVLEFGNGDYFTGTVEPSTLKLVSSKGFYLRDGVKLSLDSYIENLNYNGQAVHNFNLLSVKNLTITGSGEITVDCKNLQSLRVLGTVSKLTITNCSGRLSLDCSGCRTLTSIKLPKGVILTKIDMRNTSITTFEGAFEGDSLAYAFNECSSLTNIKLNLLSIGNPENFWNSTFYNCSNLTTIEINNPDSKGQTGSNTFKGCVKLVGGKGTKFSSSNISYTYAKNDNSTPGYFKFIGDKVYEANVYNSKDARFNLIYDKFPGLNFNCEYIPVDSRYALDYWLVWNGTQWENKGSKDLLLLSNIKSNPQVSPVIKLAPTAPTVAQVKLSSFPLNSSKLTGAGTYKVGDKVVITARPADKFKFKQWEELVDGQWVKFATSANVAFIIGRDRTFRAVCEEIVDPYNPSKPGGGDGNHDDTSDPINKDVISNIIDAETGDVATIFVPGPTQFRDFFNYLYTDEDFVSKLRATVDKFGSLGGNPLDYILNCYLIPIKITPNITNRIFRMGWYPTNITMDSTTERLQHVDLGSIKIEPYWGNALDYKSRIQIYLPYIGYQDLDCAEVMGKTIQINYSIDLMNADCVAKIFIDGSIHYQFNGNMGYKLPVSQSNFADIVQGVIAGGVSMAAGGAMMASGAAAIGTPFDMAVPAMANTLSSDTAMASQGADKMLNTNMNIGGDVKRAGNIQSNMGFLSVQTPYVIINRPRLAVPENYAHYHGYPSNITCQLGTLKGYTQVSDIHLEGIPATSNEIGQIENLLKGGVII